MGQVDVKEEKSRQKVGAVGAGPWLEIYPSEVRDVRARVMMSSILEVKSGVL